MTAFPPVHSSVSVLIPVRQFSVYAYYTLLGDGTIERDYGIAMPTDQPYPENRAIWPIAALTAEGEWIRKVGLAPSVRHRVSSHIAATVGDFEMFAARILRDLRSGVAEPRPRPLRVQLSIAVDLKDINDPRVIMTFVQMTDHGELAQMRGWKCEDRGQATVEPPVARAAHVDPWAPVLSRIGSDYDDDLLMLVRAATARQG